MFLPLCFTLLMAAPQEQPKPAENTVCPVMGHKVNEESPTVVVNGRAYRICCAPCGPKLEKDPGKYLNPDGTLVKPAENTVCPVMGHEVSEKSPTVVVNGRAYRVCCAPCGPKLEKDPDKYLNPDGTLKNEEK